jgi:hypothetical protein
VGTSAGYSAPPSWRDLKGQVTRAAGNATRTQAATAAVLRNYIRENGGSAAMARRGGVVGRPRAGQQTAARLGAFVANVASVGLNEALTRAGWDDLIGRPTHELLNALIDRLTGGSSTIDDVDARNALARLQDRLLDEAATVDDVERILGGEAENLEALLAEFFGYYIYEQFCRVFFERLVQRVGEGKASSFLGDIEELIAATLANRTAGRELAAIQWDGKEGRDIVTEIMETTLHVFETEE